MSAHFSSIVSTWGSLDEDLSVNSGVPAILTQKLYVACWPSQHTPARHRRDRSGGWRWWPGRFDGRNGQQTGGVALVAEEAVERPATYIVSRPSWISACLPCQRVFWYQVYGKHPPSESGRYPPLTPLREGEYRVMGKQGLTDPFPVPNRTDIITTIVQRPADMNRRLAFELLLAN